jgi:hypothetical protein
VPRSLPGGGSAAQGSRAQARGQRPIV